MIRIHLGELIDRKVQYFNVNGVWIAISWIFKIKY